MRVGHPGRGHRVAARLPGVGRGPVPGPAAARLRGHPRRHHRGVGARAAAPDVPRRRRVALQPTYADAAARRARRSPSRGCARRTAACSTRSRRCSARRRRRVAAACCSASSRPTVPVDARSRGPSSWPRARRQCVEPRGAATPPGAGGTRSCGAPYLRDGLARLGVVVETFETACTWDRVRRAARRGGRAARRRSAERASPALVTCRFTHVYPDGPAPYFTVYAAGRRGGEVEIWDALKRAASDAIAAHGGTITHHHASAATTGPGTTRQRPEPVRRGAASRQARAGPDGIPAPAGS